MNGPIGSLALTVAIVGVRGEVVANDRGIFATSAGLGCWVVAVRASGSCRVLGCHCVFDGMVAVFVLRRIRSRCFKEEQISKRLGSFHSLLE